jgi:hypothetical protein
MPGGAWAIDYADNACQLLRNFSSGDRQITLHLQRIDLGPELALVLVGDSVPVAKKARTVRYQYGPNGQEREGALVAAPRSR